jgi:hypothetical protein
MFTKGDDFPKYETKKGGRKEKKRIEYLKASQNKQKKQLRK